ncbi:hypothetical protein [Methylomagnum ishizawai]|uniref:hypothetical protein n=1 Tax=Methylomagnum ishizawai TaxID=1760988 RepID=UPI001C342904|nr:hypothetical protein [Methylomagnum ishizawai]BBL76073.1 hypothetical protein MishRS11D_31710 [Methylomagnum ishizawai]
MHIEAELDDIHAERLRLLQERLQKPLALVLADAIDAALALPPENDEPSPLYRALDAIGFIGCIETDEQLSTTYKQKLDFSHKCGGSQ